jgi:hypothetical protein
MTEVDRTGRTVVGLFRDRRHADEAIRDLRASGFPDDRIGLAMQDSGEALVTVDAGARTGEALAIMQRHEVDLTPGGDAGDSPESHHMLDSSTPGAMTERRRVADPSYRGPERRLIGV